MGAEQNKGIAFEKWIAQIYENNGKKNVKHNVLYTINKQYNIKAQIDVQYGRKKPYLIECKYRQQENKVQFSDMAIFAAKLELLNTPYKKGIMITNTDFEPRAKWYGHHIQIQLINGEEILKLYNKQQGTLAKLFNKKTNNLETVLQKEMNNI